MNSMTILKGIFKIVAQFIIIFLFVISLSNLTYSSEYISKKKKDELAGYFELIFHEEKKETEIAYLGLLKEYQNKKLGSFLLTSAIKNSFSENTNRVWVHTCSLDHKNALNNYISRGMRIYKTESISI